MTRDLPFHHHLAAAMPRVHRAALGLMGDEQEAREIAQEALMKAYQARDRYDRSRPFYPWMYRILRNLALDAIARRRHRATPGLDDSRVHAEDLAPADRLSTQQDVRLLREAMRSLSEEHREILSMRHFQDLSYAEMAELLEVPKGTVMSRLYRARKALVQAMGGTR